MEQQLWDADSLYVKMFDPLEVEPGGAGDGKEEVADSEDEDMAKMAEGSGKKMKKKGVMNEKATVALKNHSLAERRRRERINGHLATLRGLVPAHEKTPPSFTHPYTPSEILKDMLRYCFKTR